MHCLRRSHRFPLTDVTTPQEEALSCRDGSGAATRIQEDDGFH